uniref:Uncharacterized protein n=1 Tax=Rhizophora mucronata TaxID=61149 RepID=A0A2P2QS50_RHIMU
MSALSICIYIDSIRSYLSVC